MTVKPYLIANMKASCGIIFGMSRRCRIDSIDLLNQKFGSLTVIEKLYIKGTRGVRWKCKCDCGNDCIAYGGHLRAKGRTSCGCKREVNIEKTGCKILYKITKRKCMLKNRVFEISLEKYYKLIKGNCFYCNSPPSQIIKRMKSNKPQIIYNGIDRIDSSIGYNEENCVSCCKYCNQSKSNLSIEDWKSHLLKIVKHTGIK